MSLDVIEKGGRPNIGSDYALAVGDGGPTVDFNWLAAIQSGLRLEGIEPPFELMDEYGVPVTEINTSRLQQMADTIRQNKDRIIAWAAYIAHDDRISHEEDAEIMNRFLYNVHRVISNGARRALGAKVVKTAFDQIDITRP